MGVAINQFTALTASFLVGGLALVIFVNTISGTGDAAQRSQAKTNAVQLKDKINRVCDQGGEDEFGARLSNDVVIEGKKLMWGKGDSRSEYNLHCPVKNKVKLSAGNTVSLSIYQSAGGKKVRVVQ